MALNNLFREPQREITETAVGFVLIVVLLSSIVFADYWFAMWLEKVTGYPLLSGMAIGLFGAPLVYGFVIMVAQLSHRVGEEICETLERRGIYLLPRRR